MLKAVVILMICALIPKSVYADPISGFTEDAAMGFGSVVVDPYGDVITLTSGGGISAQNGSMFIGGASAAAFSAQGDANTAVTISFSSGDSLSGAGSAMAVGSFTHDAGMTPAFDSGGNISFHVGAALTVNSAQATGGYSGSYTVFLEY